MALGSVCKTSCRWKGLSVTQAADFQHSYKSTKIQVNTQQLFDELPKIGREGVLELDIAMNEFS